MDEPLEIGSEHKSINHDADADAAATTTHVDTVGHSTCPDYFKAQWYYVPAARVNIPTIFVMDDGESSINHMVLWPNKLGIRPSSIVEITSGVRGKDAADTVQHWFNKVRAEREDTHIVIMHRGRIIGLTDVIPYEDGTPKIVNEFKVYRVERMQNWSQYDNSHSEDNNNNADKKPKNKDFKKTKDINMFPTRRGSLLGPLETKHATSSASMVCFFYTPDAFNGGRDNADGHDGHDGHDADQDTKKERSDEETLLESLNTTIPFPLIHAEGLFFAVVGTPDTRQLSCHVRCMDTIERAGEWNDLVPAQTIAGIVIGNEHGQPEDSAPFVVARRSFDDTKQSVSIPFCVIKQVELCSDQTPKRLQTYDDLKYFLLEEHERADAEKFETTYSKLQCVKCKKKRSRASFTRMAIVHNVYECTACLRKQMSTSQSVTKIEGIVEGSKAVFPKSSIGIRDTQVKDAAKRFYIRCAVTERKDNCVAVRWTKRLMSTSAKGDVVILIEPLATALNAVASELDRGNSPTVAAAAARGALSYYRIEEYESYTYIRGCIAPWIEFEEYSKVPAHVKSAPEILFSASVLDYIHKRLTAKK